MTTPQKRLNTFLVHVFNDILRLEEMHLRRTCKNLSLTEMHVLEAVNECAVDGFAGMAEVAAALRVTPGTATVSVKTLEQKGYLLRMRNEKDKRRVSVTLTQTAQPVLTAHTLFHENLVEHACDELTEPELASLCNALDKLHLYFTEDFSHLTKLKPKENLI